MPALSIQQKIQILLTTDWKIHEGGVNPFLMGNTFKFTATETQIQSVSVIAPNGTKVVLEDDPSKIVEDWAVGADNLHMGIIFPFQDTEMTFNVYIDEDENKHRFFSSYAGDGPLSGDRPKGPPT